MLLTLKIIHKFPRLVRFFFLFRLNLVFSFTLSSSTKIIAKKKERKDRNYFLEYWV